MRYLIGLEAAPIARRVLAIAAFTLVFGLAAPAPVLGASTSVDATDESGNNLIPFNQRYRVTADDALRDAISSRANRTVSVEPGMTVTSIARSRNGRWMKVRIDGRTATGFIQTKRLERIASGNGDDPLAALARQGSGDGPSSLDLGELTRSGEIEQRHRRNAERRRAEAERRRRQEELERLEEEQEEMERQLAEEQRRLEDERRRAEYMGNSESSGVDLAEMALYAIDGFSESSEMLRREAQKTQRLANQAFAQKQRESERRQREARRRQAELQRQQRAAERRAQEQEAQRRQAEIRDRQREIQRQHEAAERRRQQIARQQEAARRQAERSAELQRQRQQQLALASGSGSSVSSGGGNGSGKIYEPRMETALGENESWFSDQDLAAYYARLKAVHDIDDACVARGARSDRPTTDQMRSGDAPPRWSFGSPQCRQGGWEDREYVCRVEVAGTCYRRQ